MLTKLRVKGFKNLLDTEVHFGPFTCIAGPNASGKSNLFDAIMFLRDLSDFSIIEAACRVRDRGGRRRGDLESLFTRHPSNPAREMEVEAEFVVAKKVKDDFDRETSPTATHLVYRLRLRYQPESSNGSERIELVHESLTYVPKGESRARIGFPTSSEFWNSVIGQPRRSDYISTEVVGDQIVIKLRQDGVKGRALEVPARTSPRTVLGTINTEDKPTALAARREMQSWTLLQLEPSELRQPDEFSDDSHIAPDGAHMPATLVRLGANDIVTTRLAELLPDVAQVRVDIDDGRRLKTLMVVDRDGISHSARSLSDGTLRFLALSILSADTGSSSVLCLEEPENGINPARIPAIVKLLRSIAVSPDQKVSEVNPLRQVIINTHSPVVVQNLDKNDLLVALPYRADGITVTTFGAIEGTWRTAISSARRIEKVPIGTLTSYLVDDVAYERRQDEGRAGDKETVREYVVSQGVFDFMHMPPTNK